VGLQLFGLRLDFECLGPFGDILVFDARQELPDQLAVVRDPVNLHRRGLLGLPRSGELRAEARVLLYLPVPRFGRTCAAPGEIFFGAAKGRLRHVGTDPAGMSRPRYTRRRPSPGVSRAGQGPV
jgi:hypothetical protein